MKTFTTRFRDIDKLKVFIDENKIENSNNLLIQISSPTSYKRDLKNILNFLKEILKDAKILGVSTSVSIFEEKISKDNIVISFTIFEKATLKLSYLKATESSFDDGKSMAMDIVSDDTKALILFSTFDVNRQRLLNGIESVSKGIDLVGLVGSDDLNFSESFVISDRVILDSGYVLLSISGDIDVKSFYKSDWEPVSKEFIVTKTSQNRVFTLDNTPLLDIYDHYTGSDEKNYPKLSLQFPFSINKDGKVITLQIVKTFNDGSALFNTDIKKGDRLRLSFCSVDSFENYIYKDLDSYEQIFFYSSLARERFIKKLHIDELNRLKSINIAFGSYGYGEYFNSMALNNSISALLLSENGVKKSQKKVNKNSKQIKDSSYESMKILSNIAKSSSNELELLNKKLKIKIDSSIKEIRKKESLMIHNSRLASLGEMLALIAHQWRQPLSAISATATGMQIKLEIGSAKKEYLLESLEHIEKYVLHLSDTIDDFTNFFKPNKKKESVRVEEIIKKALFISSSLLSKHSIEVVQKYSKDDKLYTYPNEIVQVILNIIKNSVNIFIKREIKDPTIYINEYKSNDKIIIELGDNGGGIDDKIIDKIFDPYFSKSSDKGSMGLGLYMSKFIIEESCKGRLEVLNSTDGATFKIILDSLNS